MDTGQHSAHGPQVLRLRGQDVRYEIAGPAEAPAIVMVHGLGNDLSLWHAQMQAWSRSHRVISYDVFGHGGSSASWEPRLQLDDLAQTLIDLADTLRLEPCMLVGTSMGAVIALAAASRAPQRFARLVLCGARLHTGPQAGADVQARAQRALLEGLEPVAGLMLARWFPVHGKPLPPATIDEVRRTFLRTTAAGYASCAQALAHYDLRPTLRAARMPLLLACGALDEEIPQLMRQYAALNAHARLHILDGLGHLPNVHDAAAFQRTAGPFLGCCQSI